MSVIELTNVSKRFRGVELFSAVSLSIPEGRIIAIAGPNGSGKSVLFRVMANFVRPDTGSAVIDPRFLSEGGVFPQEFGIMIDRPGYLAHQSGFKNLASLARIRNVIGEQEIRDRMTLLGLDPDSRTRVGRYSLGMKQKLSIAQATMEKQRVLLLDEPFNALDNSSVEIVRRLLREHRDQGGTIVLTSHNQEDLDLLADEVHEFDGGTLVRRR